MSYIGISPYLYKNSVSTVDTFDDISGSFNGSTTTFNITVGGASYTRLTAKACLIVLGGIVQEAGVDYTINGGQITFTTAPVSGLTFEGRHLFGLNGVDTPTSGSVYPSSLSSGGPSWDTSGNVGIGTTNSTAKLTVAGSGEIHIYGSSGAVGTTGRGLTVYNSTSTDAGNYSTISIKGAYSGSTYSSGYGYIETVNSIGILVERLRITADGNVGIGTTNPSEIIQVNKLNAGGNSIALLATNLSVSANTSVGISLAPNLTNSINRSAIIYGINESGGSGNATGLAFLTNPNGDVPTEKVRITSSGNVGIGITNPGTALHVVSNPSSNWVATLDNTGTSGHKLYFGYYNQVSTRYGLYIDGGGNGSAPSFDLGVNQKFYVMSTGNVGIGTTNPTYKTNIHGGAGGTETTLLNLHVSATDNGTGSILRFSNSTITGSTFGTAEIKGVRTSFAEGYTDLVFSTSNGDNVTEKVRIKGLTGNVGIGTTNPSGKFHITTTAAAASLAVILQTTDSSSSNATIRWKNNGGANGAFIGSNFNVGDANGNLEFGTSNTTNMFISSTGNVGIGINPSFKLDVNGNIRAYSSTVGTLPHLYLNYDVTPVDGAAHGRIGVSKSSQNSYSGQVHIQPQYYNGSTYDYLANGLVVDARNRVGIGCSNPITNLEINPGVNGFRPVMGNFCELVGTLDSGPGYTMFTVRAAGDGNLRNLILQFNRGGTCPGIYVEYSGSSGYQPDHGNFGNAYIQFACAGGTTLYSGTNQLAAFAGKTVSWSHSNGTSPVQLIISSAVQTDYTFYHFKCFHGRGYISSIQVLTS